MATKKREIYARMAVQLRTHDRAVRAESIQPGAMGLYAWMLIQARGEETAGDVLEASALAAWGAPTAFRKRQVDALLAAELIERKGDRLSIVRYSDHNDCPEEIAANREATRARIAAHRKPKPESDVTRYIAVTAPVSNGDVPGSSSISISDLKSRSEDPDSSPREGPADELGPDSRHVFAPGTASAVEALGAFEAGVAAATGAIFALGSEPWLARDMCRAVNAHGPPEMRRVSEFLRWIPSSVAAWVKTAGPKTINPAKWLDWLNAKNVAPVTSLRRGPGGGPRGDRQGLGNWTPPAMTGTDPFGGGDS